MSEFLFSDSLHDNPNSNDLRFHSSTDGLINLEDFSSKATVYQILSDLQKHNTLRTYLQACKCKQLTAAPNLIVVTHLDNVFEQHIFNWSNYISSTKHTLSDEVIDNLSNSLTQDWLDLSLQLAYNKQPSNEPCEGIRFVFMPRKDKKYIFYDLISK